MLSIWVAICALGQHGRDLGHRAAADGVCFERREGARTQGGELRPVAADGFDTQHLTAQHRAHRVELATLKR